MIKSIVKRRFPGLFTALKNLAGVLRIDEIEPLVFQEFAGVVATGPFAGMRYIPRANSSPLTPKLVGSYEKELHPILRRIVATRYELVLDVGCAEGYYAMGLALAMPDTVVRAYDIDPVALANLEALARLNGVAGRVIRCGPCTPAEFGRHDGRRTLVVCDIEGAERDLLDPIASPALRRFDVLVEIHDGPGRRDIRDLLDQRFAPSHRRSFIPYQGRTAQDGTAITSLRRGRSRALAVDESRKYGVEWGFFEAAPH